MTAAPSFPIGDGARLAVNVPDREALLAAVAAQLASGRGFTVATLNLDHLAKLPRASRFRAAYLAVDFVVADGNPVVWLARLAGRPVRLAPGSEMIAPLAALAAESGAPVALFGATAATLDAAAAKLIAENPGLRIVARITPPFGFDPEGADAGRFAADIAASGARLCFVALGAPKQEIFAAFAVTWAPACGFVSIGAGLDFLAGTQTRAPAWVRAVALEWLWRLAGDPRRLAMRYLVCALSLPRLVADAWAQRARPAQ